MRIEIEEIFKQALKTGINLFTGAGFSLDCKNIHNQPLPLGAELASELSETFKAPKLDLTKVASIIESRNRSEFYAFLRQKYTIGEFDPDYKNLEYLTIKSIYSTNIDNLIFKIFENSKKFYINDTTIQGPSFRDRNALNYYPLHGCVLNKERPMVFTSLNVASSFSSNPRLWNDLVSSLEVTPTIFWGYSLSDPGILETLNSVKTTGIDKSQKWIVLHKENPDEEAYFKALGFNTIIATNKELLDYFKTQLKGATKGATGHKETTKELFGEDFVPSNPKDVPVREITEFYLGAAPIWSDIFRADLYKSSHFKTIQNSIYSDANTLVIGIPGSGKTTLLMQLAAFTDFDGYKIILEFPSLSRARYITTILNGEKAIVFIDNFTEEIQSFLEFEKHPNIKLVGFDREHNFEIISHMVNRPEYDIISVTNLTQTDIQEIYSRIPATIKSPSLKFKSSKDDDEPSLFEFLNLNLTIPNINDRYRGLLDKLEKEDPLLLEFLLLASYVHFCRTPLSFDMVNAYFIDDLSDFGEVYDLREKLGALLIDNPITLIELDDQDYFTTRSVILSEVVMDQVPSKYLKRLLNKFVDCLPPYKIVNYRTFRKRAHDKYIAIRAYSNWEEGKLFYEKIMQNDQKNPFLLQQGALYLSYKQQHNEAFYWIDQARNMSGDSILSIRNSHAIILFDANIKRTGADVRDTLDSSMEILKRCYKEDKRKLYHAKKFGEQAVEYFNRYGDEKAVEYLTQAKVWIEEEIKSNSWHRGLRKLINQIKERLR